MGTHGRSDWLVYTPAAQSAVGAAPALDGDVGGPRCQRGGTRQKLATKWARNCSRASPLHRWWLLLVWAGDAVEDEEAHRRARRRPTCGAQRRRDTRWRREVGAVSRAWGRFVAEREGGAAPSLPFGRTLSASALGRSAPASVAGERGSEPLTVLTTSLFTVLTNQYDNLEVLCSQIYKTGGNRYPVQPVTDRTDPARYQKPTSYSP